MAREREQRAGPAEPQQLDEQPVEPDVHNEYQQRQIQRAATAGGPPPPPVASFTYSPPTPGRNQAVTFDASASQPGDASVPIAAYDWDFNSGAATGSGVTATWQTPNKAGSYPVQLTVTADDGQTGTDTQTLTVS
jgi:PKD repeat protein